MVPRRVPVGLILAALLAALMGVLATVQYRWIGKVSEAEREQLKGSLAQRARELTADFDREITRAYLAYQPSRRGGAQVDWAAFTTEIDRWRAAARFPQMVRGVYLAEAIDKAVTLRPFDHQARAFAPDTIAWPAHLEPVRTTLTAEPQAMSGPVRAGADNLQVLRMTVHPVAADVPALVIPVANPFPRVSGVIDRDGSVQVDVRPVPGGPRWFEFSHAHVIVDLDQDYLSTTVLPGLADRHFPAGGAGPYRLAVLGTSGPPLFQRGFPAGVAVDADKADQTTTFFALRPDLLRDVRPAPGQTGSVVTLTGTERRDVVLFMSGLSRVAVAGEPRPAEAPAGLAMHARVQSPSPGWRLVVQHGAGSLDAAVSAARRRNLWLSFSILAVLAAGVALVVVNARRSEQLAARQMDFVATVSHELRTPLAVIRSAAQNLSAGVVSESARAQQYGQLIEDEGRRLTDMVEQVMAYAGLEGSRRVRSPRPVDMQGLVESVAAACRPLCEAAGCELEVDTGGPGMPPVPGDEAALGRALHNLVSNAVKHGADGRWVGVRLSACSVRGRPEILLTVSDRGRGIDAADLAHVFEPFRRGRHAVEQQVHGNGLGLNLVKRIVEAHGGRIAVTSTPGAGATFALYLPAGPPVAFDDGAEAL